MEPWCLLLWFQIEENIQLSPSELDLLPSIEKLNKAISSRCAVRSKPEIIKEAACHPNRGDVRFIKGGSVGLQQDS